MAEWLYEAGIGENRAILVDGQEIVEAAIELPGLRAGAVVEARLLSREGIAALPDDSEALVSPVPAGVSEGATFRAELVREAIPEPGRPKPPRLKPTDKPLGEGPSLHDRIGGPASSHTYGPDRFEAAGWSELLDEAASGEIAFPDGALRLSLTPAMALFDVDGSLPPAALAEAGAAAAVRAIRRLDLTGSIGIDLPTLPKAERQAAAAIIDQLLPLPFERSAVNGFGFLQIVRRRLRPSLPELLRADPIGAAARALLRRAERVTGALTLAAGPVVIARLEAEAGWLYALARRCGGTIGLRADATLAISAGHVEPGQS